MSERICESCGAPMPRPTTRGEAYWSTRRFCSSACVRSPEYHQKRFWAQAQANAATGCLEWTGTRNKNDYGMYGYLGKRWVASRLAYFLANGSIDPDLFVLHSCDNPPCINPEHLSLGDNVQNAREMVERGRAAKRRGTLNTQAKITEDDVRAIRRDQRLLYVIAREFGITYSAVSMIKSRKRWAHVRDLPSITCEAA